MRGEDNTVVAAGAAAEPEPAPQSAAPALNALLQRFQRAMQAFHRLGGAELPLEKYGITPAQVAYLDFVATNRDCRLNDLAAAFQYSAASVSTMVRTLEQKELLIKQPEPQDARALRLALTRKGQKLVAEIEMFRRRRLTAILERLDAAEQRDLLRLLEKALCEPAPLSTAPAAPAAPPAADAPDAAREENVERTA